MKKEIHFDLDDLIEVDEEWVPDDKNNWRSGETFHVVKFLGCEVARYEEDDYHKVQDVHEHAEKAIKLLWKMTGEEE